MRIFILLVLDQLGYMVYLNYIKSDILDQLFLLLNYNCFESFNKVADELSVVVMCSEVTSSCKGAIGVMNVSKKISEKTEQRRFGVILAPFSS